LAAEIEDRLGIISEDGMLDHVETLGELRRLVAGEDESPAVSIPTMSPGAGRKDRARGSIGNGSGGATDTRQDGAVGIAVEEEPAPRPEREVAVPLPGKYIYPVWPWLKPFQWIRSAFIEVVMRPLVWLLAAPRIVAPNPLKPDAPMLIIANHVTAFDGPLVQYALPGALRRHMAMVMSGELLEDYRHFRNSEPLHPSGRFFLPGPLFYYLLTALFNVFPLPRRRDFQPSFAHAGRAMDRGFNVLVFPEGTRSTHGKLAPFRPGIGLLAKQCGAMVLPVALRGLGELKAGDKRWFRSGSIEVRVGQPLRLAPGESEASITARLHGEVERLLAESY
jgi:long-chain acyl-CoA synthetase